MTEQDITGSPYAIRRYRVNQDFGGNEALAQLRRQQRELPWEAAEGQVEAIPLTAPGPEELLLRRERLRGAAAGFPTRQRRLLWLHALGFSYTEMAGLEGCTPRTVERQLLRARRGLRTASPTAPAPACAACAQRD